MSGFRHGTIEHVRSTMEALQNNTMPPTCGACAAYAKMSLHVPLDEFQALDFVMLTEEYDSSLMMLRRKLGWSVRDMMYRRLRTQYLPGMREAVAELEVFLKQPADVRPPVVDQFVDTCLGVNETLVYNMAVAKYQQQWQSFSPAEQAEIASETTMFRDTLAAFEECCDSHTDDAPDALCQHMLMDNEHWSSYARQQQSPDGIVRFSASGSTCSAVIDAALTSWPSHST